MVKVPLSDVLLTETILYAVWHRHVTSCIPTMLRGWKQSGLSSDPRSGICSQICFARVMLALVDFVGIGTPVSWWFDSDRAPPAGRLVQEPFVALWDAGKITR